MTTTKGLPIAAVAVLLLCGCGYRGEPLPPLLNIPDRVTDLAAVQRGARIFLQFTFPKFTTEGVVIRKPVKIEARAGISPPGSFNESAWAANAKDLGQAPVEQGRVHYEIPAAEWIGKEVIFGVKAVGANGRDAGWSNLVALHVLPPLEQPTDLKAESVPAGVRLTWHGQGPVYRVFRLAPGEKDYASMGDTKTPEWLDHNTQYAKTYRYKVQAVATSGKAVVESDISREVSITPVDVFPPAVPSGLTAVPGTGTIELTWNRDTDPDLAGYLVFRATGGGRFEKIADTGETPSFSDQKIKSGTRYRYAVSAVDKSNNESKLSAPLEITAP